MKAVSLLKFNLSWSKSIFLWE